MNNCISDALVKLHIKLIESKKSIYDSNVYLDNNATTKPCNAAIIAYNENIFLGNASSLYATKCVDILKTTRENLLYCIGLPSDSFTVIFTGCASESINGFLNTMYQNNSDSLVITTSYEHITALLCSKKFKNIIYIDPDVNGIVSLEKVQNAIQNKAVSSTNLPIIVNIMQTNNETGSTNFINKRDLPNPDSLIYHADIVQAFCKYPIIEADAYSISFHKIYGIQGCGALVINNKLCPIFKKYAQIKGHQNDHMRGGTENIALISSINATLIDTFNNRSEKNKELLDKKNLILDILRKENYSSPYSKYYDIDDKTASSIAITPYELVIFDTNSINTILVSVLISNNKNFTNLALQKKLLENKIIISIGSACSKGKGSHVLKALKSPSIVMNGALRISLGDNNTDNDCYIFCSAFKKCIEYFC